VLIEYKKQLLKDIETIPKHIRERLDEAISRIETAKNLQEIENIKKLKGYKEYYRISIGTYRLGFAFVDGVVILSRFLHRKEIYRFFP